MAPALIAVAEKAQDIAAALEKFLDPVDNQSAEITALMAKCLSTSSALRDLDRTIGDFPYHRRYPEISTDLTTVKDSLNYTFRDVKRLFGGLGGLAVVPRGEYRLVWEDLCEHFRIESGNSLERRLDIYSIVLRGLTCTLIEGLPRDRAYFNELIVKLESLLDAQHDRFIDAFDEMNLGAPVATRPSFERRRPAEHIPQPRPEPHPDQRGGGRGNHQDPNLDDEFLRGANRPPPAPDVPGSPTGSNTFSTQSSNLNSVLSNHWLPEVFNQSRPATPFQNTGQTSISLAPDMPGSSTRLEEQGFVNLLELPFEEGDLLVRLYQRSHDYRSRFFFRTLRPARLRKDVVLPLVLLEVSRSGPFLKFFDLAAGGRSPKLWACLKFSSYERMVLFFCAFLALRSEDLKTPIRRIVDCDLHREEELFAGRIADDHYEHGLRLFKEKDTGVIRLQASAQTGDLRMKPIWTAFITHQILSPTWMSRDSPGVVHLADLQRYVFIEEYNPPKTPTGKHELTFIESRDAKGFVKTIKELVKSQRGRRRH